MSVEKSHLIRKANRGFEAIADAYLVDDEDDFIVDEDGNLYALVEKSLPSILRTEAGRKMVQAKSKGFGRFDSVVGAKMNMKRAGEAAARTSGQTRQGFIASGKETKNIWGVGGKYNSWMPKKGKLDPRGRVAALSAQRQEAAKISAARKTKATEDLRQTGRGVLP
jgi:hypothetical protein